MRKLTYYAAGAGWRGGILLLNSIIVNDRSLGCEMAETGFSISTVLTVLTFGIVLRVVDASYPVKGSGSGLKLPSPESDVSINSGSPFTIPIDGGPNNSGYMMGLLSCSAIIVIVGKAFDDNVTQKKQKADRMETDYAINFAAPKMGSRQSS